MANFGRLAKYFMDDPTGETGWDVANGTDDPIAYMLRIMLESPHGNFYTPMFKVSGNRYYLGEWADRKDNASGGDVAIPLLHPFMGIYEPIATYNNAPFIGYSGIGVQHPLHSIYGSWDFDNMPAPIKKALVEDFMKSPVYNFSTNFKGADPIEEPVGVEESVYPFIAKYAIDDKGMGYIDTKMQKSLRKRFSNALNLLSLALQHKNVATSKELKDLFRNAFGAVGIDGYMPSKEFLDDLMRKYESTDWKKYVSNYMHDSLLHNLGYVLRKGTNIFNDETKQRMRIIQAATRLKDLVPNADVAEGKSAGLREGSGEYVTLEFLPKKDFGGMLDFFDREGNPVEYDNLRSKGVDAEEAWEETIGDRLGDRDYLISDKDTKNVRKMFNDDIDSYIRRHSILNGCCNGITV